MNYYTRKEAMDISVIFRACPKLYEFLMDQVPWVRSELLYSGFLDEIVIISDTNLGRITKTKEDNMTVNVIELAKLGKTFEVRSVEHNCDNIMSREDTIFEKTTMVTENDSQYEVVQSVSKCVKPVRLPAEVERYFYEYEFVDSKLAPVLPSVNREERLYATNGIRLEISHETKVYVPKRMRLFEDCKPEIINQLFLEEHPNEVDAVLKLAYEQEMNELGIKDLLDRYVQVMPDAISADMLYKLTKDSISNYASLSEIFREGSVEEQRGRYLDAAKQLLDRYYYKLGLTRDEISDGDKPITLNA